ncbi:hypothetical protein VW29_20200 [Devosia limi DSM 17137]|uniref:Uncharacterized conserved protein YdeI, YjbR/CyaY-like superfamily, DUF1801 family n=1 Tax=Devosia limi DSM 17137 TaxID=1121477 RepID=A0A0F5L1U4_9HYPH|nr:YdeI/OmpD-associated family protein [Devosia limi]KKB76396.1 hypothetical protein VW29_20200 [Devosia limi DSM 17137]SHF70695.1 Uncharacterized conserved protein YdeI, YjbR/CyaY-like superfamily, DUF1801 family [Devosia limi DSM 17137]
MAPVIPNPDRIRSFTDQAGFEAWLAQHHDRESELWLRIYKKGSDIPTITYHQALDVALCWGWIDGIKKSHDEVSFLQRFTPRRARSIWSQVNRTHIDRLIEAGRMTEHGLRHVDAAKADGRWDAAYAASSKMEIPDDLMAAIAADPRALASFESLNKTNRFAMAFRVGNLKTPAARQKKIDGFVEMLVRGETIHPNGKAGKA